MTPERSVILVTADGITLEALMSGPASPRGGVVICHPHPLYGGDRNNPVVTLAAEEADAAGLAALRFNFRGVGRSTGTHGKGDAEQHDVEAALGHLRDTLGGGASVAIAGYSFGAMVAARVAARSGKVALGLIAPPLAAAERRALPPMPDSVQPILIVAGSRDDYCPAPIIEGLRREMPDAEVRVIDGADHFFSGSERPLRDALASWARRVASR